ncbi:oxidoreductase [Lysobacter xinjiangensis]|uniref:Oxidoreductase n=1 Tax=Cognatilysobacter xinjiangensis TaxID=546892 RepID=A0ABQ3BTR9_9GAMM|nr:oxidoreductase [Lysobacter xinjiangensis]GGZ56858.1 oxidoreductase [Lysobacter xinjiangensis]
MTSRQQPIGTGFSAASTAEEVMAGIDLSGRRAVVTGGYSGIGLVTARALAEAGATVIVPARDRRRAEAALAGTAGIEVEDMDLTDPASIAAFARRLRQRAVPVSILINSAGVMATPLFRDAQGHEGQFATNHLGHYRLTCGLWPLLTEEGARVVAVSSRGHQIAGVDFDDIDFLTRSYDKWTAYGQSKTANALFALGLDRRGAAHGVRAFSLHPGQILTDLARHLSAEEIAGFGALDAEGRPIVDPSRGMKTVEQGAATGLWCATSPALRGSGGVYCEDCDIAPVNTGELGRRGVARWACDAGLAERLWSVSETLTGLGV